MLFDVIKHDRLAEQSLRMCQGSESCLGTTTKNSMRRPVLGTPADRYSRTV